MATYKHIRSSTANKRPTTSIADGQLAINNNSTSAGLFFKDSTGATIIKIGPVHVGTTAPNATPGAGGSSGNSTGEVWLDTSLTPVGVKIWNGSAWVNGTPTGSTTVQGLLELATDVETQAGSDAARAVTPAGLQSKVSDSTSTTSSTTIASSTAVKSAYDLANAALPKSGGTVTGNLEIGTTGSLTFEGSTADGFETTLAVVDPTGDRTITLPNISGTVVTTGDTGTVTSTMLLDGTIVNADINASAAIAGTKISPDFGSQTVQTTGVVSHALGTALAPTVTFTGDTNTGLFSPGSDQLALATGGTGRLFVNGTGEVLTGTATSVDGNWKVQANAGAGILTGIGVNNNDGYGVYLTYDNSTRYSGAACLRNIANSPLAFETNNTERMRLDSSGRLGLGTSSPAQLLHIKGSGDAKLLLNSSNNASDRGIYFATSTDNEVLGYIKQEYSTGRFEISSGSASYSSSISFRTGGTADRVFIDSAGRVGIGTSSPQATCHVNGAILAGSALVALSASNIFFDQPASALSRIGVVGADTSTAGTLRISQYSSNGSVGRDVFSINSSGNVGIGTNAPAAPLGFGATTGQKIDFYGNNGFGFGVETYEFRIATDTNSAITFKRGGYSGSESGRFDSSGRLGLGTSSPSDALHLASGNFRLTNGSAFTSSNATIASIRSFAGSANQFETTKISFETDAFVNRGEIVFSTGDDSNTCTEKVRIDYLGRLGIGTTSPQAVLSVSDGTVTGEINPFSASSTCFIGTRSNHAVSFQIQASEKARIDTSGRLLVGTSSGFGNSVFTKAEFVNSASYANIVVGRTDGASGSGSTIGTISFLSNAGGAGEYHASIAAEMDAASGSGDKPGRLVFSTTADGASSPTERMRIKANGVTCIGTSTEGTMSGDTVVAIGPNIGIISKSATGIATSGTVDISINTGGGGYQGFLVVSNTDAGNAAVRTHTTFSVFGRGTDSSIQQIATDNGTTSGASFTVTTPTNGVIRVTNTSASSKTVNIQFFGGTST